MKDSCRSFFSVNVSRRPARNTSARTGRPHGFTGVNTVMAVALPWTFTTEAPSPSDLGREAVHETRSGLTSSTAPRIFEHGIGCGARSVFAVASLQRVVHAHDPVVWHHSSPAMLNRASMRPGQGCEERHTTTVAAPFVQHKCKRLEATRSMRRGRLGFPGP